MIAIEETLSPGLQSELLEMKQLISSTINDQMESWLHSWVSIVYRNDECADIEQIKDDLIDNVVKFAVEFELVDFPQIMRVDMTKRSEFAVINESGVLGDYIYLCNEEEMDDILSSNDYKLEMCLRMGFFDFMDRVFEEVIKKEG